MTHEPGTEEPISHVQVNTSRLNKKETGLTYLWKKKDEKYGSDLFMGIMKKGFV